MDVAASLADLDNTDEWMPQEEAQALLGCSASMLDQYTRSGVVDRVQIGGRSVVNRAQVYTITASNMLDERLSKQEFAAQKLVCINSYLADRPATDDHGTAVREGRPLISSRRGTPSSWRDFGLRYHSVSLRASWVSDWITQQDDVDHSLAVSESLMRDRLLDLPGTSLVHWVTPLNSPGEPRRATGWVRLDPRVWEIGLPADLAAVVNGEGVPA